MCLYIPDMVLDDTMKMSEYSQNSTARLLVNLSLDQCVQNKAFKSFNLLQNTCAITIL